MNIPPTPKLRQRLSALTPAQLRKLHDLSGVPVATLQKIRLGTTANPGVETVRRFLPHITTAKARR